MAGYNPDYISNLIRQGKMDGQRIGRNWFTTEDAVRRYMVTQKFVSPKDLVMSIRWLKRAVVLAIIFAIGWLAWRYIWPQVVTEHAQSDFGGRTPLQTKQAAGVEVTTYSDETGEIGISVKSKPE